MSLNGLDDGPVAEAYRVSLAEAGGWFLLKYTSRDSVEILKQGTGGVPEAKAAVAGYTDPSPLYGFLLYRRRKVLLKYVPEDTSRLLKVRVQVHFEHIQERFAPWDTVFELSEAEELTDAALGSACALHTAANTNTSPAKNKKLSGITEYTETDDGDPSEPKAKEARPGAQANAAEEVEEVDKADETAAASTTATTAASTSGVRSMIDQAIDESRPTTAASAAPTEKTERHAPSLSRSATTASQSTIGNRSINGGYASSIHSTLTYDYRDHDRRNSSQTLRPTTSDLHSSLYTYKPKVKLGPRPSMDTSKRPHTSGSGGSRQVATLPAGVRAAARKTPQTPQTPQTQQPKSRDAHRDAAAPTIVVPPPPIPHTPHSPSAHSRPTSSHSTKTGLSASGVSTPRITPEKQRLMKAMEMRKKQQQAARERAKKQSTAEGTPSQPEASQPEASEPEPSLSESSQPTSPAVSQPELGANATDAGPVGAPSTGEGDGISEPDQSEAAQSPAPTSTATATVTAPETTIDDDAKADSEVQIVVTERADHDTDDTRSITLESSPISGKDSSPPSSTRPSSVSDSEEPPTTQVKPRAVDAREEVRDSDVTIHAQLAADVSDDRLQEHEGDPTPSGDGPTPTQESMHVVSGPAEDETQHSDETEVGGEPADAKPSRPQTMVYVAPVTDAYADAHPTSTPAEKNSVAIDRPPAEQEGRPAAGPGLDPAGQLGRNPSTLREKRHADVEPIHIDVHDDDADYLSDDSFIEELKSATVQEAKPVAVSKSPMSPFFNRPESSRSVSNPSGLSPGPPSLQETRSLSATYVGSAKSPGDQAPVPKKINVSSGISQRIKALTDQSNRESSASPPRAALAPDGTVNLRKSSLRTPPSRSSSTATRPGPVGSNRNSLVSRQSSPDLHRHPSTGSQSTDVPPVYTVQHHDGQADSVSVTARIVRDPADHAAAPGHGENASLELHQSPLIISHNRASRSSVALSTSAPPPPPVRSSSETNAPTLSGAPSGRESSMSSRRNSTDSTWRSLGRRMSDVKSPPLISRTQSSASLSTDDGALASPVEEGGSKKSNRASRLLKRMSSSISNASKKSLSQMSSPTREDVSTPQRELATVPEPPAGTQLGDLNVQFPDTLLWKRRWVEIDGQGSVVLQAPKSERNAQKGAAFVRRYHLTEFSLPYAPDQDRQEMPYSIILDFLDGRTLQCACEDASSQTRVLELLQDCHRAWVAYQQ